MKVYVENSEQGICPRCGSDAVEFGYSEIDDAGLSYYVTCPDCGLEFSENNDVVFAGHWVDEDDAKAMKAESE